MPRERRSRRLHRGRSTTSGGVNANLSRARGDAGGQTDSGVSGGSSNDSAIAPAHREGVASAPGGAVRRRKPSVATPELDAKVEKAESRREASGASEADKLAAAAAYVERGNFYRDAGTPALYKLRARRLPARAPLPTEERRGRAKSEEIVALQIDGAPGPRKRQRAVVISNPLRR